MKIVKKLAKVLLYYVLGIVGILGISVAPSVIVNRGITDVAGYFKDLGQFIKEFINPDSWVYITGYPPVSSPLLETLWEPFLFSMKLLVSALIVGFVLAFILAILVNFLPKFLKNQFKKVLNFLEAVPDLLIAVLLQLIAIYYYQETGNKLFTVAGYRDNQPFFAPVVTLAILPMISLFKILLIMMEEELLKDYVVLAKGKGLKKARIIFKHILKNIGPNSFYHSKVILWGSLSSLFIIERVYNVHGLTEIIMTDFRPIVVAIALIMLFTPFFLFYQLVDVWLDEERKFGRSISQRRGTPIIQKLLLPFRNLGQSIKGIRIKSFKPWAPIVALLKQFIVHMKNVKFAIGAIFLIALMSYSIAYSVITDNHVDQKGLIYEEDGATVIAAPPYPPGEGYGLGTDTIGFSIYDQIVIGAKYTIIFAMVIALLRVLVGLFFGTFYAFYAKRNGQKWIEKLVDSTHFLPLSVIAFLLLSPILIGTTDGFYYSFTERIVLEIIILTILVVPMTTVLTGNEIKNVLNQEFISSARILGGSKFHILRKHVLPHIGPRLTILFGQQFIQVLLIFIHLGVFELYFGGTILSLQHPPDPPKSVTNEWSGLIGNARDVIRGRWWMLIWVLIAFMLLIFAMQLIVQGVKEVQQEKVGVLYRLKKLKVEKDKTNAKEGSVTKENLTWANTNLQQQNGVPLE